MKRFLLVPLAAISLSGCAAISAVGTVASITQAIVVNKDKVLVPATQGLIVAHNAYQGAAAAAEAAITACSATPNFAPCKALLGRVDQIGALSDLAKMRLDQADAGQNVAQNVADVMNIVATLKSLAGA